MQEGLSTILKMAPVIPVLTVDSVANAVALARALVAGGLPILEITLRSDAALDAIEAIAKDVDGAIVGAGTVIKPDQISEVAARGARFAISPGATPSLLAAGQDSVVPFIPAAATASEAMVNMEYGYTIMKFFPAESVGGIGALRSMAAPLPAAKFCPTGGITAENAVRYLALDNVLCVGGSWVAPAEAVRQGDWAHITELARLAAAL